MAYVTACIAAVPTENKGAYLEQARLAARVFGKHGVVRAVECWGDDIPKGKVNDFYGAVQAKDGEEILLAWQEWPSKEAHQQGARAAMQDPDFEHDGQVPFDMQRMIWGGFEPVVDTAAGEGGAGEQRAVAMPYILGFAFAVPEANRQAYIKHEQFAARLFRKHGVVRTAVCWGDEVPRGKVTDFHSAVQTKDGEAVLFGWQAWPSKEAYEAGMKACMEDPETQHPDWQMPFDGTRMMLGRFVPILDTADE